MNHQCRLDFIFSLLIFFDLHYLLADPSLTQQRPLSFPFSYTHKLFN